jgi:predicted ATPase
MLLRLSVKGFKSLFDADICFGPFTCIAGINGVGKSNLFDAMMFLRDLTEFPVIEAAARVRNREGRQTSIQSLFTKSGSSFAREMAFEAEFLVSPEVLDDFGRSAKAKVTHLIYELRLRYVAGSDSSPESVEIRHEALKHVIKGEADKHIGFAHSAEFFKSVYVGVSRIDFLYTEDTDGHPVAKLRQEGGSGSPSSIPLKNAQRTALSSVNTADRPTALAARREMQSWMLLQLEPSALRQPDDFFSPGRVSAAGAHLPSTLARIGAFDDVANRLSELIPDVVRLYVDTDEKRQSRTLMLETRDGTTHAARALSDGTLRFLALAVIGMDTASGRVIFLEEPENGIHPARVRAMLDLLHEICVDPQFRVDGDNPLRQVIFNTHSPSVVGEVSPEDLVVAEGLRTTGAQHTRFLAMPDRWRTKPTALRPAKPISLGLLTEYLHGHSIPDRTQKLSRANPETTRGFLQVQLDLFEHQEASRFEKVA